MRSWSRCINLYICVGFGEAGRKLGECSKGKVYTVGDDIPGFGRVSRSSRTIV